MVDIDSPTDDERNSQGQNIVHENNRYDYL